MAGRSTNQDEAERGKAEETRKVKVDNVGGGGTFLVVQVSQRDEGAQKKLVRVSGEPYGTMKPSSDRSVKACTEGGSTVGGWVGRKAARVGEKGIG